MKCLLCESISLSHICQYCQKTFLTPTIYRRKILNKIEVISFYKYRDIKDLLYTKHRDLGYYIYSIMAKNSFREFASTFEWQSPISSISIDDKTDSGYSHTAILNRELSSRVIHPEFAKLRAKNDISYAGKNKEFRIMNPREFHFKPTRYKNIVIVDDIITTGSTLSQAITTISRHNHTPLFCLTLADANAK